MIRLDMTSACQPEQYDAFCRDELVGYLRYEDGHFYVQHPWSGGETLYEAHTTFDGDDREYHLTMAKAAILERLAGDSDKMAAARSRLEAAEERLRNS